MARFSAFLDACVLVPVALAATLLRLAEADLDRPLWSNRVLDEMVEAIERIHPNLSGGAVRARGDAMQAAFDDSCVTGWEPLESGITLPDPADRHVVAAALRGRADMIVTANLRDFPSDVLGSVGLEVQHPDDFLLNQLDLEPDLTMATLHRQAAATKRPAFTTPLLPGHLAKCGVPGFASEAVHHSGAGAELHFGNCIMHVSCATPETGR